MSKKEVSVDTKETPVASVTQKPAEKPAWVTPTLEDVSEQVMAQPYIRFT
jgi:precorrin-4 methylase